MKNSKMIGLALDAYYHAKGKKIDSYSLDGFLKRVREYSDEDILEAIDEARFSEAFPDVTVPLAILKESFSNEIEDQARLQWNMFHDMVRYYSNVRFDDVITAHIAQKIIHIGPCKEMKEADFDRVEKRFVDEYKKIASNSNLVEEITDGANELKSLSKHTLNRLIDSGRILSQVEAERRQMEAWTNRALAMQKAAMV